MVTTNTNAQALLLTIERHLPNDPLDRLAALEDFCDRVRDEIYGNSFTLDSLGVLETSEGGLPYAFATLNRA